MGGISSCACRRRTYENRDMSQGEFTDFGFQRVPVEEKSRRVYGVFASVAPRYDLMNDLMSLGIHRLWKRFAVDLARVRPGNRVLDVAGGTGDMARLFHRRVGVAGSVVLCDINREMLMIGRNGLLDEGICRNIAFIQGDAENLPFTDNSFDLVCIAFGLRNVTDKSRALESMYSRLKFGGSVIILEFSKMVIPVLGKLYDKYSSACIPFMGRHIADDEESYRYLVESIRVHPDQETLKGMMIAAGFARVEYYNLSGGIVAVHQGFKI